MIHRLRLQIVAISAVAVAVVLLVAMSVLILTTRSQLIRSSETQLLLALDGEQDSSLPGEGNTPCFVAEVNSGGTVHLSGSSYYDLQDEDWILAIVQEAMQAESDSGVLPGYHLRYLRQTGVLTVRIAFTDSTLEQTTLQGMMLRMSIVSLAALNILTAYSYVLSGYAVQPVKQAWKEQKQFVSDASHELKTPLTVILSSADLAAGEQSVERLHHYNENIRAESLRMKALVESMLTLARTESGNQSPAERFDLSETVLESALAFEPVAFEAGKQLQYEVQPALQMNGTRRELRQLADILLDNAVKYAAPRTEIRLSLHQEGRSAVLWVENSGETVPPEKLAHLFDRFYRADASRTASESFGLGLAIAQSIARQHRGNITCTSAEGVTRFTAVLPLLKG